MILKNKNVLIGVTASISIYKTLDLIRELRADGANVRVVMTPSSARFVSALTFEAISGNKILNEETENWYSDNNHIGITKWLDMYMIAPCSMNTLNKLSNAIADNLVTQIALTCTKQIIIAPAANTNMINHPLSDASMRMLSVNGYHMMPTQTKLLVCGDVGDGGLASVLDMYMVIARYLLQNEFWSNRKVILTGGGTKEAIDDVRYISNHSSGKMATSLANALYMLGADVCLVRTDSLEITSGIHTIDVDSSEEMLESLIPAIEYAKQPSKIKPTLKNRLKEPQIIHKKPYLLMAAAVGDYKPQKQNGKIKKKSNTTLELSLSQNIDILKSIEKSNMFTVGFKAELDRASATQNAKNMLKNKNLDAVCLNVIGGENEFGSDNNQIDIITDNNTTKLELKSKKELSFDILYELSKLEG